MPAERPLASRIGITLVVLASGYAAAAAATAGPQWSLGAAQTAGFPAVVLFAIGVVWPYAGLLVWLCLLPLFDAVVLGPAGLPLTPGHAALAGALTGWVVRSLGRGPELPKAAAPLLAALAALPVAGLLSAAGSPDPALTVATSARLVLMWGIAAMVASAASKPRRAGAVHAVLVVVGCAMAGVAFVQLLFPGLGIGRAAVQGLSLSNEIVRPAAFFRDPNFLGGYLSACAVAAAALAAHARRAREALPWLAGAGVCAAGVLVTASRSALVGLAIGALFVVATAPPKRRNVLAAALLVVVLAAAPFVPRSVYGRMAQLLQPASATSLSTRYLMALSDARMFVEHAPAGIGLGAHDTVYPAYRLPGALPRITHPHQVPVSFVAETGLVGLLALAACFAAAVAAGRRMARAGWQPYAAAASTATLVLVVESLFQYYLFFEYLWIWFGLFAAAASFKEASVR
ncbi:O-antigen ligase family protein [Coriobacteriia bacterium Es71-Z0120]|uniref:O-antigen ligase family protein n=1 Tax=Parvivirga hydrogeniphila TaxID=2939460 RepID=UPI002260DBC3|nr:O-antigen ligase family protein [Parvivirga hydrogeniphila]MCL4079279.1 O-antigen ligase family protein [Parvivirga hydrogeniphila]